MELAQYARFDMIYIGIYSPRPGTLAHRQMIDDVPRKVKHDRRSRLNEQLKIISQENNQHNIGSTTDVMITSIHDDFVGGYTASMKNISLPASAASHVTVGEFATAQITGAEQFRLQGELL
jgi:tRNA-2-methylthio-N6-dimethylallyladenosine synthase